MEPTEYTLGDVFIQKCLRGKIQDVRAMVEDGLDINYRNKNGSTALHAAAAAGQLEVAEWLIQQKEIELTAVDDEEQSALFYAAFHGHLEVVQLLVEHGLPLEMPDKYGRLVHCAAALNGHLDVVTYFLEECRININAIDEYGGTVLHWAAVKGRKEVVQYLCRRGVDIYLTSYDNRTALQLAKDKHKHKCVQFLKSWVERVQQFLKAAEEGNNAEIERIIESVNNEFALRYLKDKDGKNALHWAAGAGHTETLKLLAAHFDVLADVDKFGRNALHWAALGGHKACALWLCSKSKGALIHSLTLTNKSPSRCAFEAGHVALAAKLQALEEGHDEVLEQGVDDAMPPTDTKEVSDEMIIGGKDMKTINEWLKQIELEQYTQSFAEDGFDNLRRLAIMDESDLVDMDVKKGHRRVVLSQIEDLKQQLNLLDEKTGGEDLDPAPTLTMLPTLIKASSSSSTAATQSAQPMPIASVGAAPVVDAPSPQVESSEKSA